MWETDRGEWNTKNAEYITKFFIFIFIFVIIIIIITGVLNSIRDYVFILQKSVLQKLGIEASKTTFQKLFLKKFQPNRLFILSNINFSTF